MLATSSYQGKTKVTFGLSDAKNPDAKKIRDQKARELRKQGYTVTCKTWNFVDLARCFYYTFEATKTE